MLGGGEGVRGARKGVRGVRILIENPRRGALPGEGEGRPRGQEAVCREWGGG